MSLRPPQIKESHLRRRGIVYIRQSSTEQVRENIGSTALQRELVNTLQEWGWPDELIDEVDEDLGRSGSIPGKRRGFDGLLADMRAGTVGIVIVIDISRLARNDLEEALFAMTARQSDVLLAYGTTVVDFRDPNSAFVARILGINAGRENAVRIALSREARRQKADKGIAVTVPPIGYIKGPNRAWLKHPDPQVRDTIQLIFDKFLELGSAGAVYRFFVRHGIKIPWQPRRAKEQ